MEVDNSAIDERKEGGSAALLQVDERAEGSRTDSPLHPIAGQLQISR